MLNAAGLSVLLACIKSPVYPNVKLHLYHDIVDPILQKKKQEKDTGKKQKLLQSNKGIW